MTKKQKTNHKQTKQSKKYNKKKTKKYNKKKNKTKKVLKCAPGREQNLRAIIQMLYTN